MNNMPSFSSYADSSQVFSAYEKMSGFIASMLADREISPQEFSLIMSALESFGIPNTAQTRNQVWNMLSCDLSQLREADDVLDEKEEDAQAEVWTELLISLGECLSYSFVRQCHHTRSSAVPAQKPCAAALH